MDRTRLSERLAELRNACAIFDEERLGDLLEELVPGYRSEPSVPRAEVQVEMRDMGSEPAASDGVEQAETATANVIRFGPRRH